MNLQSPKSVVRCPLSVVLFFPLFLSCSSQKGPVPKESAQKIQVSSQALELTTKGTPPAPTVKKITQSDVTITPLPVEQSQVPQGTQVIPFQPTMIKGGMAVQLLLDASGRMNGLLGTETKFDLAVSLIENLSAEWQSMQDPKVSLGLRLFGSQSPLEKNDCDDSQLLFPPAPIDLKNLEKSFEKPKAAGKSPLSLALHKAADDLAPSTQDRVIILLTGGKDNCGQDPCSTAKELFSGPSKIIIHVVGFDVAGEDEEPLKCIANSANGIFLLARTKEELASSLDEALRSTIPYNLRIKTLVGGTPLPATITAFKAGTQTVVKKEESFGIELFRLPAGSYDILVAYASSIETKKPSKILKGVELTEKGKVEQEIRFDLASVTLSAQSAKGEATPAHYTFFKTGTDEKIAEMDSGGEEATFFIAPGTYDLTADSQGPDAPQMRLSEPQAQIAKEQGFIKHFSFQTGTIILKGENSKKEAVGLTYKVTRSEAPEIAVKEGQVEASGGKIDLPPGTYDVYVEGQDPALSIQPKGILKNIAIEGGSILEKTATLIVGMVNLKAQKADGKLVPAEFKILDAQDKKEIALLKSQDGKAQAAVSPGKYDIQAAFVNPIYTTPPTTTIEGVQVDEGKTLDQTLVFSLGTLKLLGRNAKEQRLKTTFVIYGGGTENVIAQAGPSTDWFEFNLAPGNYDVKATQEEATEPKPITWQRDIPIEAGALIVREAVFTNAKIKLIGRGSNSEIVPVDFKIYEYGHDRPLVSGTTGQDWQTFDLIPGQYYIEAKYLDDKTDQVLKKWITLKVGENEFVEKELRF